MGNCGLERPPAIPSAPIPTPPAPSAESPLHRRSIKPERHLSTDNLIAEISIGHFEASHSHSRTNGLAMLLVRIAPRWLLPCLPHYDLGVRLAALRNLSTQALELEAKPIPTHPGALVAADARLEGQMLSGEDVWLEMVCESVSASNLAYSSLLDASFVDAADVLVIHDMSTPFVETVEAVIATKLNTCAYWVDILSTPRVWQQLSKEELKHLMPSPDSFSRAIVVFDSATEPVVLESAWTLFQLHAISFAKVEVLVQLPPRELKRAIADGFGELAQRISDIDASRASARSPAEAELLREAMAGPVGAFEARIRFILRPWLISACQLALKTTPNDLRLLGTLGRLNAELGNATLAFDINRRVLERAEQQLGWDHKVVTTAAHSLAELTSQTSRPSEALPLYAHARLGRQNRDRVKSNEKLGAIAS